MCLIIPANNKINKRPNVTCTIDDVVALVRKIRPHISETIGEYINQELLPNIGNRFSFANHLDVVFDQYHSKILKSQ